MELTPHPPPTAIEFIVSLSTSLSYNKRPRISTSMYRLSAAILAFVGTALAANSTLQLWVPQNPELELVGSLVSSVYATATTYSIACVSIDRAFPTSFLVTEGPSSIRWTFTNTVYNTDIPITQTLNCQFTDSSSGVCSMTAERRTSPYLTSTVLITSFANPSDMELIIINTAVTITASAGGSSTSVVAASTTGSGSSSAKMPSSLSSTGTSTGSAAAVTGSSSSSGTPSSTSVSSAEGAPMITQAPWVFGAAAVMAYAAM
ncbi:hypothetical protein BKA65DRAFT_600114 [Rhexocercosporidium sp. MPI-PUGE-AT-0058]|nr:hypothetical protein BKA65DRAFT_600114 [Rhexocercosporidium sp. MPI-PUGE-AT-0058]